MIEGGLAITCAIRPGFAISDSGNKTQVHPDSPAGVFLREFQTENGSWEIPGLNEKGSGAGFGSSTAELISAFIHTHGKAPEIQNLWPWFKEKFPQMSGADLATQIYAMRTGEAVFEVNAGFQLEPLSKRNSIFRNIQVFKTAPNLKIKTHEDLSVRRVPIHLGHLNHIVQQFKVALQNEDLSGCRAFTEFADALSSMGRESVYAGEVRKTFASIPGVLGVKGCGASLHDVFVVACEDRPGIGTAIEKVARDHDLASLGSLEALLW